MKYQNFHIGELVLIDHGTKPLGMIMSPMLDRGERYNQGYGSSQNLGVKEYLVEVFDQEELIEERRWYYSDNRVPYFQSTIKGPQGPHIDGYVISNPVYIARLYLIKME